MSEALRYATSLATALWEKHWKSESPNWKPLPDLVGVLTQIDNMTAGLARQHPQQDRAPQGENDPHAPDCPMYGRSYVSPCTCGAPSASIDAAQPAQREGWVLVPKEPTDAMIASAREHHEGEAYLPVSLYRAMLAAAPSLITGEKE